MRAPADKRDADEIVAEIVSLVGCPHLEVYIRKLIDDLSTAHSPFTGNRRENIEYAKDVRGLIKKLDRKLKAPLSRFLGDRFWSLGDTLGTAFELNPQTRGYISQESPRLKYLIEELNRLRSRCELIIERKLGQHRGRKHLKAQAANASFNVLDEAANYTGKKTELSCWPTSDFVRIASLFFEAATGNQADLQQACKTFKASLDIKTLK